MKFYLNDLVQILAGKDKGKTGKITKILKKSNQVVVEGINKKIKHLKGRGGNPGERLEFFAPFDISNIAIVDPEKNKPTRIGFKFENKEKIRYAKLSGAKLPIGKVKTKKTEKTTSTPKKEKTSKK